MQRIAPQDPRSIRTARRVSQLWIAAEAKVSIPLVRLYEKGGPDAVADDAKRADLDRVYARLAEVSTP